MKTWIAIAFGLLVVAASGAQEKAPAAKMDSGAPATTKLLETKIRKVWADYKNKDKHGLGSALADDFREVTDGSDGIFGKETDLSEMEKFTLSQYELSNFHMKSISKDAVLMTYSAHYSGAYEGTAMKMSTVYGEVWVRRANEWKQIWGQETKLK